MTNIEHALALPRYREWAPTGFDPKGLNGDDNGVSDYIVLPVIRTRDSGPFEESNFHAALKMLGGESDEVQVHRFGHWGPGWFEIILVDPESDKIETAGEIVCSLEDYPLLDEDDFSEREYDEAFEVWERCYNAKDRIEHLRRYGHDACSLSDLLQSCRGLSLAAVRDYSSLVSA